MASSKPSRQSVDRFAMTQGILDVNDLILDEMLDAFDAEANGDPLLTPWRRGHRVAIRSAFGH
jgi:hypothetical protein